MSHDLLGDAARALREETGGPDGGADATRMRIVGAARAHRRRELFVVRAAGVLLAAAIGGTAWAGATGHLPSFRALESVFSDDGDKGGEPQGALVGPREGRGESAAARGVEPASVLPPAASADEAAAADVPVNAGAPAMSAAAVATNSTAPAMSGVALAPMNSAAPAMSGVAVATNDAAPAASAGNTKVAAKSAAAATGTLPVAETHGSAASAPQGGASASGDATGAPGAVAGAPGGSMSDGPAEALYTRAHTLHFQAQDYGAARAAWEAYLKAAPTGRYASFAHYNRAICLLRLGRRDEARRALESFASGAFGGYRKAEAQSLLDAMGSKGP